MFEFILMFFRNILGKIIIIYSNKYLKLLLVYGLRSGSQTQKIVVLGVFRWFTQQKDWETLP